VAGFNFEDRSSSRSASPRRRVPSIHIEEFECVARAPKLAGRDHQDIPNVGEGGPEDLDDAVRAHRRRGEAGDILVGKNTPKWREPALPEEKRSRAIFGEKAGDVRDSSLQVPRA